MNTKLPKGWRWIRVSVPESAELGSDYIDGRGVRIIDTVKAASQIDALRESLSIIVTNAEIQEDARTHGTTDIYAVPIDDIEAARNLLDAWVSWDRKKED